MNFSSGARRGFLLITVLAAAGVFGQSSVSVNVGGATAVVNKEIFGGLMERLGRGVSGGIYVGTSSSAPNINGIRTDVIEGLKECGFAALQWPGGCAAQGYNWNPPNPSNDLGTDRFMQLCSLSLCTPILTGRSNNTYAASNKAWVRYINNKSGWTLKYFQLGNEVWGCGGSYGCWSGCTAPYKPNYDVNYDSLKVAVNNKPITTIAGTDGIWKIQPWLKAMLADNVNRIENIEVHDYIYFPDAVNCLTFTDAQYYDILDCANGKQMRPRLDEIIATLNTYDPGNRIKIWEGEWGNWLIDDGSDGWRQNGTLMDALAAGETLNLFVRYAHRMLGAGLAQVVNVIQSIMNTESTHGALVKTPTFYVFKLLIPHQNAKYAPTTLTSEKVNNINAVSAAATVNSSGYVHVSLTNIDLTASRTVNVSLTNSTYAYACSLAQVVTGPAKNSWNNYSQPEVVNVKTLAAANYSKTGDRAFSVTLPARSIVMLSLRPTTPITGVMPASIKANRGEELFSIRSLSSGKVLIKASVEKKTPVTISLYSIDGRTLVERTTKTLDAGNAVCEIGTGRLGKGVYLVKITGDAINYSRQVVSAK